MARKLLGTASNWFTRVRVYLGDGAIEVDEIEGYSGTRKRVLFDEVLLVTLDRRRLLLTVLLHGGIALFFVAIGVFTALTARATLPGVIAASLGAPFWILLLLHLAFGVDQVTVFGKRTTAQMRFTFRKRRAREMFAFLRDRAREAQRPPEVAAPADTGGTAAA
jgi:hypothetical protein